MVWVSEEIQSSQTSHTKVFQVVHLRIHTTAREWYVSIAAASVNIGIESLEEPGSFIAYLEV